MFFRKNSRHETPIKGNARPQHMVYKQLEDEELGSLL